MSRVGILIERDPDGGTYIHVAVDGELVDLGMGEAGRNVDVWTVDAGAGHDGDGWFDGVAETVREAVATHGEAFASSLLDAYRHPPGYGYIDDYEAALERFDAATPDLEPMREE